MNFSEEAAALALLGSRGVGYVGAGQALLATAAAGLDTAELFGLAPTTLFERLPDAPGEAHAALSKAEAELLPGMARSLDRLHRAGGQAVLITDNDYPTSVRSALGRKAPPVMSVLGDSGLLNQPLAAVAGARKASTESAGYTRKCAQLLVEAGYGIVSGAAKGIDEAAHAAALEAEGSTVLVLPEGVLRYRGPEMFSEAMELGRAALVSEFLPDAGWARHAAVTRNTTIAAFAEIVCVIEPRGKGGTLLTAEAGLAQGKSVLFHCAGDQEATAIALERGGATRLPVFDDVELEETLRRAQENRATESVQQRELF